MPQGNYNYGASYIMNSDKTTVEASFNKMADDKNYF